MVVLHIRRRSAALLCAVVLVAVAAVTLAGCFGGRETATVTLPDEAAQVAYLQELGWETGEQPLETLDLQLPETLNGGWQDYAALQAQQSFPLGDYAGQAVRRYTYAVYNYPGLPEGVQANLYLCGELLIGGDIIATGKGGFQTVLAFPG